jgi:hypothetical protein
MWQNSIRKLAPPKKLISFRKKLFLRQFPVSVFILVYSCPFVASFRKKLEKTYITIDANDKAASVP